ncbi:terminase small subunit [Myxococcus sp. AS-1-15]|uniref:terminase small subunit n=1 Tax=Myxococcus sp. AS-1-15 TaxID=2874600 RepID=UPI001CBD85B4|nr:terminase small subunit [Myxococcus sp. AS-1-15]MBZ4400409.1 terminase small subunit [Myxococcus sp. AS-1-15]
MTPSEETHAPDEESRELTPKQRAFVREFLKDSNSTQAAIRAGYSKASAESQGSRLLRNAKVLAAVEAGQAAIEEAVQDEVVVEVAEVLRELKRLAFSDIGQGVGEGGAVLPLKDMPEDFRRAISSIEVEALFAGKGEERVQVGTVTKVKLWPKDKSLELLGKYLKLFTDKLELTEVKKSHEEALGELE